MYEVPDISKTTSASIMCDENIYISYKTTVSAE
jgi:hypothetical protein